MRNSRSKRSRSRFTELLRSGGGVRAVKLILCAALFATVAVAQSSANWRIDTFAGLPKLGDNGPAIEAQLRSPFDVAADGAGNVYIADTGNDRIRKVDSAGNRSTAMISPRNNDLGKPLDCAEVELHERNWRV